MRCTLKRAPCHFIFFMHGFPFRWQRLDAQGVRQQPNEAPPGTTDTAATLVTGPSTFRSRLTQRHDIVMYLLVKCRGRITTDAAMRYFPGKEHSVYSAILTSARTKICQIRSALRIGFATKCGLPPRPKVDDEGAMEDWKRDAADLAAVRVLAFQAASLCGFCMDSRCCNGFLALL